MPGDSPIHVSVLMEEVLAALDPQPGQLLVDGTLGAAGHTSRLADAVRPGGQVIAFDRDLAAIEAARSSLGDAAINYQHQNFAALPAVLNSLEIDQVDGVLLDLGLSSDQLADRSRGFSFDVDGPLDMRFDTTTGEPAWRLLERLREKDLADLIYQYGEERFSRRIAREIVAARKTGPITTANELADLVRRCVPRRGAKIDGATRTFQALRIAVNDELESLAAALSTFAEVIRPGGAFAVITFHSLEDRMVKHAFRDSECWRIEARKGFTASEAELHSNPRSRSARLRVGYRA